MLASLCNAAILNPTEVKFSLTRGDSQISVKGVIPKGDLVYRQYCLLPAPKHTLKIIFSYFPGATRFPYYISILTSRLDTENPYSFPGVAILRQKLSHYRRQT